MLALLSLWEEELGRRRERVAGHQHQLLELQQLLNVLLAPKDNGTKHRRVSGSAGETSAFECRRELVHSCRVETLNQQQQKKKGSMAVF